MGQDLCLIQPAGLQSFDKERDRHDQVGGGHVMATRMGDDMANGREDSRVSVIFQTVEEQACRLIIADT